MSVVCTTSGSTCVPVWSLLVGLANRVTEFSTCTQVCYSSLGSENEKKVCDLLYCFVLFLLLLSVCLVCQTHNAVEDSGSFDAEKEHEQYRTRTKTGGQHLASLRKEHTLAFRLLDSVFCNSGTTKSPFSLCVVVEEKCFKCIRLVRMFMLV